VGFLAEPQNQGRRLVSGLASKPLGRVSRFGPQNRRLRFGDLGLKITVTVSWFVLQNYAGYGLSVAPQTEGRMKMTWGIHRDLAACFAWKQVGLGFFSLASRLAEAQHG
jgi:hypothetical protein